MSRIKAELEQLARDAKGSFKTISDRIKKVNLFDSYLSDNNIQIKRVEHIKTKHIEGFIQSRLAKGISKRTLQNDMSALRVILAQAGREKLATSERLSSKSLHNILSQLRNFIECIAVVLLAKHNTDVSYRNYEDIQLGLKNIQSKGQYKDLKKFHTLLQKSVSHYTVSLGSSERLMLKYYEYLLKVKNLVKKELSIDILMNISDFPLNQDPQLSEYYEKIS